MATSVTPKHYPFGAIPAGFDPNLARQLAPEVADDVQHNEYGYDRARLVRFQTAAGTDQDGLYGPYAASALAYYGVAEPPRHLFKVGDEIPPYRPPNQDQEVVIDVPGPGGSANVVPAAGVEQAGFDVTSALLVLASAVSIGAGAIRDRVMSHPIEFSGHRGKWR